MANTIQETASVTETQQEEHGTLIQETISVTETQQKQHGTLIQETISVTETQQKQHGTLVEDIRPTRNYKVCTKQILDMRDKLRDPRYRNKLIYSWLIASAFFSFGLAAGLTGVTLLDLQIITGVDLEKASAFVTGYTGGYMGGSLVYGAIFSKVNTNLLLFMAVFGMGAATIATPYCGSYALMVFMRIACGFFAGSIDTSGNAAHMLIWGNDGKMLMQIIHFCFAAGGVFSPIYSEPFLAKRNWVTTVNVTNFTSLNGSTALVNHDLGTTNVHYAFIISGVFMIVGSTPFLLLFARNSHNNSHREQSNTENRVAQRELPLPLHLFMLSLVCTFFMLYTCVELTFSSFLMTFLINQYDFVTKATAVYITTKYWILFASSRFLMIFVSHMLLPVRVIFVCLTLMVIAYTGFLVGAINGTLTTMSVFTAVAGLGMSGVYAAGYSWTESQLFMITARVTSSICIISSVGKILNPVVLGFLMEMISNMWFCYLLLGETIILCLEFVFILLFNRYYVNKRYRSLDSIRKSALVCDNVHSLVAADEQEICLSTTTSDKTKGAEDTAT